jgi:hypothetical protein
VVIANSLTLQNEMTIIRVMIDNLNSLEGKKFHVLEKDERNYDLFISELKAVRTPKSHLAIIDVSGVSERELFELFVNAYNFPDYFGYNWDALDERINDLDWLDATSYILVIKNIEKIKFDTRGTKILVSILMETVDEWTRGRNYDDFPTPPTPFHIIFISKKENLEKVINILAKNGITDIDFNNRE